MNDRQMEKLVYTHVASRQSRYSNWLSSMIQKIEVTVEKV
jgi:hypothetical protein